MTQLQGYLRIDGIQPQFAACLSTLTRPRGYPPFEGQHSLIVDVAPTLAMHRVAELALIAAPDASLSDTPPINNRQYADRAFQHA